MGVISQPPGTNQGTSTGSTQGFLCPSSKGSSPPDAVCVVDNVVKPGQLKTSNVTLATPTRAKGRMTCAAVPGSKSECCPKNTVKITDPKTNITVASSTLSVCTIVSETTRN
ncbi:hypothetical protein PCASD_06713 [Puccinia coronata f. sp. avenae]|uniref:Uncharacterized protein n=1 Tax=Puccinia coronata f. sp. avenae TaxID=200324 RepID=A0A2N5TF75_9BASI|nr:hypothetical protein PCASD_06713 [Puccinia coronata f. sp. avenae]